ncbi:hypothetical protein D3C76_1821380 [compost metagenome]
MIVIRTAQSNGQYVIRHGFARLQKNHPALQIDGAYLAVTYSKTRVHRKLDAQVIIGDGARSECVVFCLDSLVRHPVH